MLLRNFRLPSLVIASSSTTSSSSSLLTSFRSFSFNNIFTAEDHKLSLSNPEKFWAEKAEGIDWIKKWDAVLPPKKLTSHEDLIAAQKQDETDYLAWFPGSELNISYNCLDRHILKGNGNKVAVYYDSAVTGERKSISYNKLFQEVNILARVLVEDLGVKKGDVVVIYFPNGYRIMTAMLACARIGAIHSVVFGGFAAPELAKRIVHGGAKVILTCSGGIEGTRLVDYVSLVEDALKIVPTLEGGAGEHKVEHVLFHQRKAHPLFKEIDLTTRLCGIGKSWKGLIQEKKTKLALEWNSKKNDLQTGNTSNNNILSSPFYYPPTPMKGHETFYILYSSGTTGNPKGIVHETAGMAVMLHSAITHAFGVDEGDCILVASDAVT